MAVALGLLFGLMALDGAMESAPSSWGLLPVAGALWVVGNFLPVILFEDGWKTYADGGLRSAVQRHWSGVVGLALVVVARGLAVASVWNTDGPASPAFWGITILALAEPVLRWLWPRPQFGSWADVAIIAAIALCVIGFGQLVWGDSLDWSGPKTRALDLAGGYLLVGAFLGFWLVTLKIMDWLIARSERRE